VKRFAEILVVNIVVAASLFLAGVALFVLMNMVREFTGWSAAVSAISTIGVVIVILSAVCAWLESL
jgi:uncharacterized membrane protein